MIAVRATANFEQVLGIDPSLTCTGVANLAGTHVIRPPEGLVDVDRLAYITDVARMYLTPFSANGVGLVVMEGPAYGVNVGKSHERAGLFWALRLACRHLARPVAVVPPTTLKKFITGSGNATKVDVVREVTKRFPKFDGGADEADALVLYAMGRAWVGLPVVQLPAAHLKALDHVNWPVERDIGRFGVDQVVPRPTSKP